MLISRNLEVRDSTNEAIELLADLATQPDRGLGLLQDAATQRRLCFFALTSPEDDFLPIRTRFPDEIGRVAPSYGLAHCFVTDPEESWYTGLDLAASILRTGKAPQIRNAFTFVPNGELEGLTSLRIRGDERAEINLPRDDIERTLVELRHDVQDKRLGWALKIVANALYGSTVEVITKPAATAVTIEDQRWDGVAEYRTNQTEAPGRYFFAPIGVLVTGAAHLWMGVLERLLELKGTTWVAADTDGALVPYSPSGGSLEITNVGANGESLTPTTINLLSPADVAEIVSWFDALSLYDPAKITHLLKSDSADKIDRANQAWGTNIPRDAQLST
jgi:hypothetical protein